MVAAAEVSVESFWVRVWRRLPRSIPLRVTAASRIVAALAVPAMMFLVLSPLLLHPWTLGEHNWDQMNTQREVVVKTIRRFHQFPFWDPYECGGHAGWGSLEGAPIAVSPWLPAYLLLPLPIAIRVEIVALAIWGAVGCWLLASRFTGSRALRALFTVMIAVNSRWALQISAGHTWHLLYGFLPWILFLFDRAIEPEASARDSCRDLVLAAVCLTVMVYGNAIYPVPHAAYALVVYAVVIAVSTRSVRPLRAVAACGVVALGLSSPKLLPLFEEMQRFPRWIHAEEAIWPHDLLKVLTWRVGDYTALSSFTNGMWHEWGLYLGWPGLALLVTGLVASRGLRERALKWVGLSMVLFVIGGFYQLTPWRLLHLLPIFKSQHVPSRWLYPAVIALGCAAVSGGERLLRRATDRRPFFEGALGFGVVVIALDMGLVARMPIAQSFVNPFPAMEDKVTDFHLVHRLSPRADYAACLYDITTLPGVFDNVGTMECDTHNVLHLKYRDEEGRMPAVGAWGDDDPGYRGEAYIAENRGTARIESWSPNDVRIRVEGGHPGDHVVLNQNWDPGWSANGTRTSAYRDAVAALVGEESESLDFHYRPRSFPLGLAVCASTVALTGIWFSRQRRVSPS